MPPGSTSTRPGNPPPRFWDWPRPLPSAHRAAFFLFSFVEGVGGGDPPLGPLPSHSEKTRQGAPDSLARDPPVCKPLLEARLCCHLQSPKARVVSELPRGAVEHLFESLGTLLVEGVAGSFGARGSGNESIQAPLVEVVDGVAHRLLPAAQVLSYLRYICSPLELAETIWERRKVKASLERSPASSRLRSSFESGRTKIGGFMATTVTHNPEPILTKIGRASCRERV